MTELKLETQWDKVFPKSDKVDHKKVTFKNHFGITLAADMFIPKNASQKLPAIAVCGPFGAVKEQSSGLYAQEMALKGYLTIAFDPSFTGESGGEPRYMNSPDINVEDFQAAVDFLCNQSNVDPEKIGIIGICGWGGMALQTACKQRTEDFKNGKYKLGGGVIDPLPDNVPQFVKDYHAYYKTKRGYHKRSLNSNGGWNVQAATSLLNTRLLHYSNEIRSAVLIVHGDKAHSYYFSKDAYANMIKDSKYKDNKEFLSIPGASHTDLYDQLKIIPFNKIDEFFKKHLK